jgi:histidinol-phosphate phosphatase family protein
MPIGEKPLLEHQIELAQQHKFFDVLIFACYGVDLIAAAIGGGASRAMSIRYVAERTPLGTAGAVLAGLESLAEQFVIMYGDTMVSVDLERLWLAHERSGADATLLLHPNDHPLDSDLVEVDQDGRITAFHTRPHPAGRFFQNLVNAGLYVVNRNALMPWYGTRCSMDFGKDLFPAMLDRGDFLLGYRSSEYIKDIGTPQRYDLVSSQFAAGIVQRSSLAKRQRTVFLDRDGTLVREVPVTGLISPDQLQLLPGVPEAMRLLNHAGLRAVVVTNQPVVAKGFCTNSELRYIHNKLEMLLGVHGAFLDSIYWCPHHPQKGFPHERTELKIDCDCRKPKTGLIERAACDLNIDVKQSWLVGDTTTDIQTARNAGLRSVLVRTGYGGTDCRHTARPEAVCDNLLDAVRFILSQPPL